MNKKLQSIFLIILFIYFSCLFMDPSFCDVYLELKEEYKPTPTLEAQPNIEDSDRNFIERNAYNICVILTIVAFACLLPAIYIIETTDVSPKK